MDVNISEIKVYVQSPEVRINTQLDQFNLGIINSSGSFALFTGTYRTVFNVTVAEMELSSSACDYTFCLNEAQDEGFITFDSSLQGSSEVSYLIEMSNSSDSIWLEFVSFDLMDLDVLRIYDGSSTSNELLVELQKEWFKPNTGNSAYFQGGNSYALIEADDYPVSMMMWVKAENETTIIADSLLSLSMSLRKGFMVPKVTWKEELIWIGDVNITMGEWAHLAVNIYRSQGFVEFLVNGTKLQTCGAGDSHLLDPCPPAPFATDIASATAGGYLVLGGQFVGPLGHPEKQDSSGALWIDELLFFDERLDTAEVQGVSQNGSVVCNFADPRLTGCYHFDAMFSGESSEHVEDSSMYLNHANGFGMVSEGGVSVLSNMTTTTFASSSGSMLIQIFHECTGNCTSTTNFLATYSAVSCSCANGFCERGVCICDAGFGGETCKEWLLSDACNKGVGKVYGAEFKSVFGSLNLTVLEAEHRNWMRFLYPPVHQPVLLPELNCEWIISRDSGMASLDWSSMAQCFNGTINFTVYDGIQHVGEVPKEALVDEQNLADLPFTSLLGSSGELQVTLQSRGGSWDCARGLNDFNGISLDYSIPKVYYVAPNDEFLSSVKVRDGSDDAPYKSIAEALAVASANDIILLYPGRYEGVDNMNFEINLPITIKGVSGADYTILDADNKYRHFSISTFGEVTLEGISFINGFGSNSGSSLFIDFGEISLIDCIFTQNHALMAGTIYIEMPASLDVLRTIFKTNEAGSFASVLHTVSATVMIESCTFYSNSAQDYGTIVIEREKYDSMVTIRSSNFISNRAGYAASIHVSEGMQVTVDVSSFVNNVGNVHTSGVYAIQNSTVTIFDSEFSSNVGAVLAVEQYASLFADGLLVERNRIIENAQTVHHWSYEELGVVHARGAKKVEISNGFFLDNLDLYVGVEESSYVYFDSCTFSGSAVSSVSLTAVHAHFSGCSFHNNNGTDGGAISITSCSGAVFEDCFFSDNLAYHYGGAIYNFQSPMQVRGCSFTRNHAIDGGSVYVDETWDLLQVFENNNFNEDTASGNGGSLHFYQAQNVEAIGNFHSDCIAAEDGGGWYVDESEAVIENMVMTGCQSQSDGGGITALSGSVLSMKDSFFSNCESSTGGALSVRSSSTLRFSGGSFDSNLATDGGAVSVQQESEVMLENGVTFSHNHAKEDGGAVFLVRLSLSEPFINGSTFYNNSAGVLGGSVYLALCDAMEIINMVTWTSESEAGSDIASLAAELSISNSFFKTGFTGQGGIYLLHSDFVMTDSYLGDTIADENGGLVYAFASHILIMRCEMSNGTAGASGAGFFLFDSPSTYLLSNFTGNRAGGSGGAVYMTGTDSLVVHNCRFIDNYAGEQGGAIHFQESTEFTIEHSVVESNRAVLEGAGILAEDSTTVSVANVSFIDNIVIGTSSSNVYGGGGIKLYNLDQAVVSDCYFYGNGGTKKNETNNHDGGAIYVAYSVVSILSCHFERNSAYNGGAVYFGPEPVVTTRRLKREPRSFMRSAGFHRFDLNRRLFDRSSKHDSHSQETTQRIELPSTERKLTESFAVITGSSFVANAADSGGGALSYEEVEPNGMANNSYSNNSALYGSSFASPPAYIVATSQGLMDESGYALNPIHVEIRDVYDQIVEGQNDGEVFVISLDDEAKVSSQVKAYFRSGVAVFDELVVEKFPNTSANLSFSTSLVEETTEIEVHFKTCGVGEVLPVGTGTCIYCSFGTFSVNPSDTYCHECPVGAVCYGGSSVEGLAGYWRFPNSTGVCTSNIHDDCSLHACFEPTACNGDIQLSDSAQFDPADISKVIIPYGSMMKGQLQTLCWNPVTNYADCELMLNGHKIKLIDTEDAVVETETVSYVVLTEESKQDVGVPLSEDRGASYFLMLRQPEECAEGYDGNMCAICAPNYGKQSGDLCMKCPTNMVLSYLLMLAGVFAVIILGAVMIKLQMGFTDHTNEKLSVMMKIFTSYLQLVSLFSAIEMDWPDIVLQLYDKQELVSKTGDRMISIECIFNTVSADYDPENLTMMEDTSIFYKKLSFYMGVPVMIMVGCALFWYLVYIKKAQKFKRNRWNYNDCGLDDIVADGLIEAHEVGRVLEAVGEVSNRIRVSTMIEYLDLDHTPARVEQFQDAFLAAYAWLLREDWVLSVVVLLFMVHPNVSQYTFLVFTCTELETGRFFLQEDLDTPCGTPEHTMWKVACGVPFMLLYTIGIPFGAFIALRHHRHQLDNDHVNLKYGFLYDGYERPFYYWELWVMMRKIVVVCVTVFLTPLGPMTEALSGLVVAGMALILQLKCIPFIDDDLNLLESMSLYATVITLVCGLFFYSHELDDVSAFALLSLIIIIGIANMVFVCYFVKIGLLEYQRKITRAAVKTQELMLKINKAVKHNVGKTKEEKVFHKRKMKKLEVLEELYMMRADLQNGRMQVRMDVEEAKRVIREANEKDAEYEHKIKILDHRLGRELRKESARHLRPKTEGSVIWNNLPQIERQLETAEDVEARVGDNELSNAIMHLYKTCATEEREAPRSSSIFSVGPLSPLSPLKKVTHRGSIRPSAFRFSRGSVSAQKYAGKVLPVEVPEFSSPETSPKRTTSVPPASGRKKSSRRIRKESQHTSSTPSISPVHRPLLQPSEPNSPMSSPSSPAEPVEGCEETKAPLDQQFLMKVSSQQSIDFSISQSSDKSDVAYAQVSPAMGCKRRESQTKLADFSEDEEEGMEKESWSKILNEAEMTK